MSAGSILDILKTTFKKWNEDKASRLAAALSYYAIFSIGPVILVIIAIAGLVFGEQAARGELVGQIEGAVGPQAAQTIQGILEALNQRESGIIATVIGVATLILGAVGLFEQLQGSLNTIWEVQPTQGRGVMGMVKDRLIAFSMVLLIGLLLVASLVVTAALALVTSQFAGLVPPGLGFVWQLLNFLVSFALTVVLFALIYKVLPDVKIAWRNIWLGAAFTALLFAIGRLALGIYLGSATVGSAYGAAGSLVVLLVWIYYSAQIFFFGAEFTQVYANRCGARVAPKEHTEWVPGASHAAQAAAPGQEKLAAEARGGMEVERDRARGAGAPRGRAPAPGYLLLMLAVLFGFIFGRMRGSRG